VLEGEEEPDVEPMPGQWWVELFDVLPDDVLPDDVLPDDVLPDDVLPDDVLPDDVLPDEELPDEELPDVTLVELVVLGLVPDAPATSIPKPRLRPSVPPTTPAATIG
jgi:hypothetical protein